jgi:hypothetical protein
VSSSTGCLLVHACPASLRAGVESALGAVLPHQVKSVAWSPGDHGLRAALEWTGPAGTAAALTDALRSLAALTFEVTEDAVDAGLGERYSYVPGLGLYRASTNAIGDVVVDENQLAAALRESPNAEALREAIRALLGRPWDEALEPLRFGAAPLPRAVAVG